MKVARRRAQGSPVDRVLWRTAFDHGCWTFTGAGNGTGYGTVEWREDGVRKSRVVHRVVYEALIGPVPDDMDLDHLCRNTMCCNPDHLEPVPHEVNCRRGAAGAHLLARTHCPKGHPYDEENTRIGGKGRVCRKCARIAALARYHRLRESQS
jgi:hypothetical protein